MDTKGAAANPLLIGIGGTIFNIHTTHRGLGFEYKQLRVDVDASIRYR